jgi:hypothetical protein
VVRLKKPAPEGAAPVRQVVPVLEVDQLDEVAVEVLAEEVRVTAG